MVGVTAAGMAGIVASDDVGRRGSQAVLGLGATVDHFARFLRRSNEKNTPRQSSLPALATVVGVELYVEYGGGGFRVTAEMTGQRAFSQTKNAGVLYATRRI